MTFLPIAQIMGWITQKKTIYNLKQALEGFGPQICKMRLAHKMGPTSQFIQYLHIGEKLYIYPFPITWR